MIGGAPLSWFQAKLLHDHFALGPEGQGATCHAQEAFHGPCRAQWTAGQHSAQPPAQRREGRTIAGGEAAAKNVVGKLLLIFFPFQCGHLFWCDSTIIMHKCVAFNVLSLLFLPNTSRCKSIDACLPVFLGSFNMLAPNPTFNHTLTCPKNDMLSQRSCMKGMKGIKMLHSMYNSHAF